MMYFVIAQCFFVVFLGLIYLKSKCQHSYEGLEENGYQICIKCGHARLLPCKHKYEIVKTYTYCSRGMYISRCKVCGDIRKDHYDV